MLTAIKDILLDDIIGSINFQFVVMTSMIRAGLIIQRMRDSPTWLLLCGWIDVAQHIDHCATDVVVHPKLVAHLSCRQQDILAIFFIRVWNLALLAPRGRNSN